MGEPIGKKKIEGIEFTLFYDYDQLQDQKLSILSDDGKIEWFRLRMEMVFLQPLRKLFDRESVAYKELNSSPTSEWPWAAIMTGAFSLLLNGIEALGSFLPENKIPRKEHHTNNGKNYSSFKRFVVNYMKDWDVCVEDTAYKDKKGHRYEKVYLPLILWDHFRNGIAHQFVVEGGGIEFEADPTRWKTKWGGYLEIGPCKFFKEFLIGVANFFEDAKSNYRVSFLARFNGAYPCRVVQTTERR